jgi:hypothetical protein
MNRAEKRYQKFVTEKAKMTFKPVYRKRKIEDAHILWLWGKVQNGMKLEFDKIMPDGSVKLTMSHRTLDILISWQNRDEIERKRKTHFE